MRWRSRVGKWVLVVVGLLVFGWMRYELDRAQSELESVKARIERMEGQQKYLPALLRVEFARMRQELLAALDRNATDDRRDKEGPR